MESGGYEFTAQHEITFPGNLYTRDSVSAPQNWELVFGDGVQRREDARNLTSLRARRIRSHQFSWRCVMSLDRESVPRQNLGSLQGCLVEGDPEQRARERRVRRTALITSVLLQASVLAALILVPLFAKPARLVTAIATPIPPYRHVAARTQDTPRPPSDRRVCLECFNSRPADLTHNATAESSQPADPFANSPGNDIPAVPCPSCIDIRTAGPQAPTV